MKVEGVLETCLYGEDLAAAEQFYRDVLGLERISSELDRHVFFRCGDGMLLFFNSEKTKTEATTVSGSTVPPHGSDGAGHVAFRLAKQDLPAWREHLRECGVEIESEVEWPRGGRSIYFRDPAGNCLELATPEMWGIE